MQEQKLLEIIKEAYESNKVIRGLYVEYDIPYDEPRPRSLVLVYYKDNEALGYPISEDERNLIDPSYAFLYSIVGKEDSHEVHCSDSPIDDAIAESIWESRQYELACS